MLALMLTRTIYKAVCSPCSVKCEHGIASVISIMDGATLTLITDFLPHLWSSAWPDLQILAELIRSHPLSSSFSAFSASWWLLKALEYHVSACFMQLWRYSSCSSYLSFPMIKELKHQESDLQKLLAVLISIPRSQFPVPFLSVFTMTEEPISFPGLPSAFFS